MLRQHKLCTGAHYGRASKVKGAVKAFLPRRLGARWLVAGEQRRVLLTFDDGPHPEWTPRTLDALDALGARALFFVVGSEVRAYPHIIRDIVARGHLVGNHTNEHPCLSNLSALRIRREIERCQVAIEDAIGARPHYFRPPYGATSATVRRVVRRMGLRQVLWSNEGGEHKGRAGMSAAAIAAALGDSLSDDQIVLLHDDTQIVPELLAAPAFRSAVQEYALSFDIPQSLCGPDAPPAGLRHVG